MTYPPNVVSMSEGQFVHYVANNASHNIHTLDSHGKFLRMGRDATQMLENLPLAETPKEVHRARQIMIPQKKE